MADNKVKFGLSNVYYSVWDESTDTYDTPVAWPGAVNLSLDAQGDTTNFRADNIDYYVSVSNAGYSGSLESALIPESFRIDVMKEVADKTSGIVVEKADAKPAQFALMFQFEGDQSNTRHILYNSKATRPAVASQTTETSITPVTETVNLVASARAQDKIVKGRCKEGDAGYSTFFTQVDVPKV